MYRYCPDALCAQYSYYIPLQRYSRSVIQHERIKNNINNNMFKLICKQTNVGTDNIFPYLTEKGFYLNSVFFSFEFQN